MLLLIRCALGYDMGPGARPVILPITTPRNRARKYLVERPIFLCQPMRYANVHSLLLQWMGLWKDGSPQINLLTILMRKKSEKNRGPQQNSYPLTTVAGGSSRHE